MAKRWPNWRLLKSLRTYTVEEAAEALGKHENTIRAWMKLGLRPIDDRRPILFRGADVIAFIKSKRNEKRRCGPDEFYCLVCREPKSPAEGLVEFIPLPPSTGNLRAICPSCGNLMHRRVNREALHRMHRFFDIAIPQGWERLDDRSVACGNCDQRDGALT